MMRRVAQAVSWLSLPGVVLPAFLYLSGSMTLDSVKAWMLVFSAAWFASVPIWMGRK